MNQESSHTSRVLGSATVHDAGCIIDVGLLMGDGDVVENTLRVLGGLPGIECAAWIRAEENSPPSVEGVFPRLLPGAPLPPWLQTVIQSSSGPDGVWIDVHAAGASGGRLLQISNSSESVLSTIALFTNDDVNPEHLGYARAIATVGMFQNLERGENSQEVHRESCDLRNAMLVLSAANVYDQAKPSYRSICDAYASHMDCDRASLGVIEGGTPRILAVSNAEKVTQKSADVRAITDAIEECIDQDAVIISPGDGSAPVIKRAVRDLAAVHGASAHVLACPIRVGDRVLGAVVLERFAGTRFTDRQQQSAHLACELLSRRLADLVEHDRGVLTRLRISARRRIAALLGPTHTWAKLGVLFLVAFLLMSLFVNGQDHAASTATIVASETRSIAAPFSGFVSEGFVQIGDSVERGKTVLAVLDTSRLDLELIQVRAEEHVHMTDAAHYRDQMRTAEAAIADARADEVRARIRLLEQQLVGATLIAPINGVVVEGNARQLGGASIGIGQMIVKIVDPSSIYLELAIPEPEMRGVELTSRGQFITPAFPGVPLEFQVEELSTLVSEHNGRRALMAKAAVLDRPDWLVPGMNGNASIRTTRRPLLMVWTRRVTDWIRLKLWI